MTRKGKLIDKEIDSTYLNETKVLRIYHPETFSTLYKYNICFMFDGNDYYQLGRIASFSDELHESGELKNTVFVGIHYKSKAERRRNYHPEGDAFEDYKKFFVREVVPFIDDLIPTPQLGQSRILMGESLAGSFALLTALRYPNTFGKVILQSPFIDDAIMDMITQATTHNQIDIYQTIGTLENEAILSDGRLDDQLTPNRKLKEFLTKQKTNLTYYELENGEHTWKSWQKDMKRALTTTIDLQL